MKEEQDLGQGIKNSILDTYWVWDPYYILSRDVK